MGFLSSLDIVGSALTAERFRTDIITQNLANYNTTLTADGGPYRRKQVVFQERPITFQDMLGKESNKLSSSGGVRVAEIVKSDRDFRMVYDPNHPQANEEGYVAYSNVDTTEERLDLMAATNAYEANLTALAVLKAMINKTIDMAK